MKKNLLVLLCMLLVVACALASCKKDCDHTFSDEWYGDETNHWHPATCEHGEIKDSLAAHVDADENGACDVCEFDMTHEHTFAEEWSSDGSYHWHAATCSHPEEKGDYELHTDEDANGVCDLCEGHVHTMNIIGRCSGCGEVLKEIENMDIAMAVFAASENYGKIIGGNIDYEFIGRSNSGGAYESMMLKDIQYILGEGYTYTKVETDTTVGGINNTGVLEGWYEIDGDGVFGVVKEDGSDFMLTSASADSLYGYYYAISTLANAHGAENILYELFEVSQGANSDGFEYVLGTNSASFTFNHNVSKVNISNTNVGQVVNVSYFVVEVNFNFTDDYTLTDLEIIVDVYTNDAGTSDTDGFLEADVDFDYDVETGKVTLREGAIADTYTIKTTQTLGKRTATNPHPKSSFVPDSYDLFADEGRTALLGSNITAIVDSTHFIYLGNYRPEGASIDYAFDYISFEVYNGKGELVEDAETYNSPIFRAFFTYNEFGRHFFFIPKTADTYTFVIYFLGNKTHEVTIYAGVEIEDEVVLEENQLAVKVTDTYAWTDEFTFTATEAGTYTFALPAGIGFVDADAYDAALETEATDDAPTPFFDYNEDSNGGNFSVDLAAGESIRFYVSATVKGTYIIGYSYAESV